MIKKLIRLFVLLSIFIGLATSCFPGLENDYMGYDLSGAYDGSKVTISLLHSMDGECEFLLDNTISRFREIYPNIIIEHKYYDEKYIYKAIHDERFFTGEPNIALCNSDYIAYFKESNDIVCLDDLIYNSSIVAEQGESMGFTQAQLDDFVEGYYDEGRSYGDGKMYSLPVQKYTDLLYYNKTIIDPILVELGLETIATWDVVEAIIAVLKDKYPKSIPLGYDSSENFFVTLSIQNDAPYTSASGEHYLFNNDKSKAFVAKFAEWYQKGWMSISNPKLIGGYYISDAFKKESNEEGKVFMAVGSSKDAKSYVPDKNNGSYDFELGVASIPQVDPSNPKNISQGPSTCIFKNENVQEIYASWLFVKFLASDASFQVQYAMENDGLPVIKSVVETRIYSEYLAKADCGDNIDALVTKVSIEQNNYYHSIPLFAGSRNARTNVGLLVKDVFTKYQLCQDNSKMVSEQFSKYFEICKRQK